MKIISFLSAVFLASVCESFAPVTTNNNQARSTIELSATRRETIGAVFGSAAAAVVAIGTPFAAFAAEESEPTNELVETLKARSEANKEANTNYAMRANKMSSRDFKDLKMRKPSFVTVKMANDGSSKLLTKEDFATLKDDGKITIEYGTRMKQGGGEITDYNNITYILKE